MFNTNAEGSYSYYDAQGRHLTTKHVYHLPDGTLKFTLDNTHSNPKDSSNLKNELLYVLIMVQAPAIFPAQLFHTLRVRMLLFFTPITMSAINLHRKKHLWSIRLLHL